MRKRDISFLSTWCENVNIWCEFETFVGKYRAIRGKNSLKSNNIIRISTLSNNYGAKTRYFILKKRKENKFGAKTLLFGAKKELNRSILMEDCGAKKELFGAKTKLFGAKTK